MLMSLLIRTPILLDQVVTSFNLHSLITFLEKPFPNTATLVVRASIYEFGEGRRKHSVYNTNSTQNKYLEGN